MRSQRGKLLQDDSLKICEVEKFRERESDMIESKRRGRISLLKDMRDSRLSKLKVFVA